MTPAIHQRCSGADSDPALASLVLHQLGVSHLSFSIVSGSQADPFLSQSEVSVTHLGGRQELFGSGSRRAEIPDARGHGTLSVSLPAARPRVRAIGLSSGIAVK